jgi:DNA segregation ATPase FtsK/SpoIIIE, S-DNA-T family
MTSVSVTEVRNALRCPRLFALGRKAGKALAFPVGSSCLGSTFHKIVERFAREVADPPAGLARLPANAPRDDIQAALCRWLLDLLVGELETDAGYASMPAEVDDLAEALRELARHLTSRLQRLPERPAAALARVVIAGEVPVEARLDADGPLVRGRIDALYGDCLGVREIIEYKLTDEANHELDRAQVALYRALLRRAGGLDAKPVVLRFTPLLRETTLDPLSADALVDEKLRPLLRGMPGWAADPSSAPATARRDLCSACPVSRECSRTWPERLPARDDPPAHSADPEAWSAMAPNDEEGRSQAQAIRNQILAELKKEGIHVTCPLPPIVGPTLYMIELSRPRGRVSDLDRAAEDIKHRLAGIDVEYEVDGGHRVFCIRRPTPLPVALGPLLARKREYLAARPGRFVVGQRPDGTILCGDFGDAGTPHLLVGGQAGSGKSWFLLSLVASLIQFHGPDRIRLMLLDPKRVTFLAPGFLAATSAHLDGPIGHDIEDAVPALERLFEVMEERYELFVRENVQNIDDYNVAVPQARRLERKVLVIDEFGDLIGDKATGKHFFELVQRLGAKARAAGIHLVLATQRPDRQTVPPGVKANLGGKIALKVASAVNSRIILDAAGAERLLGKGDLLADLGHGLVRAQGAVV